MSVKPTSHKFVDFQFLKQNVKIEDAIALIGLKVIQTGDQLRAPCPTCESGGDRALVVTPHKSVFYCFAAGQGGDVIALTSHIKGIGMKEAAEFLAVNFTEARDLTSSHSKATVLSTVPKNKKAGLNPLTYLQPDHPGVQALGVSKETAEHFGAGYAPKGIMRGRLAIPIHDGNGQLIAYCGRALKDESPRLIFPNGFQPGDVIFGSNLIRSGPLHLAHDPLLVLTAFESGVDNVVAILTDSISVQQLKMLVSLMHERLCETVELF